MKTKILTLLAVLILAVGFAHATNKDHKGKNKKPYTSVKSKANNKVKKQKAFKNKHNKGFKCHN